MSDVVIAAMIGGFSTVIVGILSYFGHKLSKSLDTINLRIDRIEAKLDRVFDVFDERISALTESQSNVRERLARIETLERPDIWRPRPAEGRP